MLYNNNPAQQPQKQQYNISNDKKIQQTKETETKHIQKKKKRRKT
jgi:hypothetical protein